MRVAPAAEHPTTWRMVAWVWGAASAAVVGGFLMGFMVDLAIDGRWDERPVRSVLGGFFGVAFIFLSAVYLLLMISAEVKLAVLPRLVLWGSGVAAGVLAPFAVIPAAIFFAVALVVAVYISLRVPAGLAGTRRSGASRRALLEKSGHRGA